MDRVRGGVIGGTGNEVFRRRRGGGLEERVPGRAVLSLFCNFWLYTCIRITG